MLENYNDVQLSTIAWEYRFRILFYRAMIIAFFNDSTTVEKYASKIEEAINLATSKKY